MSKQTSVEFLVEQITKHTWYDEEGFGHISVSILDIEKAKQIDKENIIQAFKEGNLYHGWALKHEPEQYYNKTYKKDK
jgi:hypothetical protein